MSGGQKKVSNNLDGGNDQLPPEADPPLAGDGSPPKKPKKINKKNKKKVRKKKEKRVSPESESFHRHYPRLSGWSFKPAMKPS